MFQSIAKESEPFKLNPGIIDKSGNTYTDCVVRLLTRKDRKELAKEPDSEREDALLARAIVRIGTITDRTELLLATEELATWTMMKDTSGSSRANGCNSRRLRGRDTGRKAAALSWLTLLMAPAMPSVITT